MLCICTIHTHNDAIVSCIGAYTLLKRYAFPWLPWNDCGERYHTVSISLRHRPTPGACAELQVLGTVAYLGYELVVVGQMCPAVHTAVPPVALVRDVVLKLALPHGMREVT